MRRGGNSEGDTKGGEERRERMVKTSDDGRGEGRRKGRRGGRGET